MTLALASPIPAFGQAAGGAAVTAAQKVTAVESASNSQVNTTASSVLPAVQFAIQQGLRRPGQPRSAGATNLLDPEHRGIAAGDAPSNLQVWLHGAGGHSRNKLATGGYSLDNYSAIGGVQSQISPTFLVGASASWQEADGTLNAGFSSENTAYGLSPYVGWQLNENWNVSGAVGYNSGRARLERLAPAYSARYKSDQWLIQGALNGSFEFDQARFSPSISFLHIETKTRSFLDSTGTSVPGTTSHLTRASLGGTVSFPLSGWEPYFRAAFEYDLSVPSGAGAHGRSGAAIGAGASFTFTDTAWGSIDLGYNSIGRSDLSLWSIAARLTVLF